MKKCLVLLLHTDNIVQIKLAIDGIVIELNEHSDAQSLGRTDDEVFGFVLVYEPE